MQTLEDFVLSHTDGITEEYRGNFIKIFKSLFVLDFLHPFLKFFLNSMDEGRTRFSIEVKKNYDMIHGCAIIKEERVFDKILGGFKAHKTYLVRIKSITLDTILHEIAHCVEVESGVNLTSEFERVIAEDMKKLSSNRVIGSHVNQIMNRELKNYQKTQFLSELFARYFEMITMSSEMSIGLKKNFSLEELVGFFSYTTVWVMNQLNPIFNSRINSKIDRMVAKMLDDGDFVVNDRWQNDVKSFHSDHNAKRFTETPSGKWQKSTKSNHDWQNNFKELSDQFVKTIPNSVQKNKEIEDKS